MRITPAVKQARLRVKSLSQAHRDRARQWQVNSDAKVAQWKQDLAAGIHQPYVLGVPLDPSRFRYCLKTYSSLGNKCDRQKDHEGPCSGDALAVIFKGFEEE